MEMKMVALNTTTAGLWGRNPAERQALVQSIVEAHGLVVTRKQILAHATAAGKGTADVRWLFNNKLFRAGRGQYTLAPLVDSSAVNASTEASVA
jgi:hypothetical protein